MSTKNNSFQKAFIRLRGKKNHDWWLLLSAIVVGCVAFATLVFFLVSLFLIYFETRQLDFGYLVGVLSTGVVVFMCGSIISSDTP
jgi:H+/gluconate symporter-like permease